jgi:hypothetical protein
MHPDLTHIDDQSLLDKIMTKRQGEAVRRQRFFDVKARSIGIDKKFLDMQLEEKRLAKEAAKNVEDEHAQSAIMCDQIAMVCEHEKAQQLRAKQKECVEYSLKNLHKEGRREFALSDPNHLKNDCPARIGDDDPRCGPASIQKFAGEVIQYDRTVNKKTYQNLQKDWLLEQMAEKQAIQQAQKDAQKSHDDQVIMANHVRGVMESHIASTKRANKKAESDHNLSLAAEQRDLAKTKLGKLAEEEAAHVSNVMNNPMLNESSGGQMGTDGRLIRSNFKGMTQQDKHDVYHYNAMQMQHKRNIKRAEKEEEARHAQAIADGVAVMGSIEHHKAILEVQRRRMMESENSVIAQAQRNMQQQLKATYSNQVDHDYFNKFNASAR